MVEFRGVRALAGVAATAGLLSGCLWTQVGYGPEHRRANPQDDGLNLDSVDSLAEVWAAELPGAEHGGTETEPIVDDDRVYVARSISDTDGGVWATALDKATGAPMWERELVGGNTNVAWPVPVARTGDVLTVGYYGLIDGGNCTAAYGSLDPADGSGSVVTDGRQISPSVTAGSMAVRLYKQIDDPASFACAAAPATVRARTVSPGREVWGLSMGPAMSGGDSWPTSFLPTVADGRVFAAWGSQLHAFRLDGCGAATCPPLWSADVGTFVTGTTPPVATNGGQVLVLADNGLLRSYGIANGAARWRANVGDPRPGGINPGGLHIRPSITVAGDVAYVTTSSSEQGPVVGKVQAFAADGCGAAVCPPLWTATFDGSAGTPAVSGGVLFVGTQDAVLAFDGGGCGAATCEPVATIPFSGWAGNLSIADGRLYVAGGGHVRVYAPTPPG